MQEEDEMRTTIGAAISTSEGVEDLVAGPRSPGREFVRRASDIFAGTAGDSVARSRLHSTA